MLLQEDMFGKDFWFSGHKHCLTLTLFIFTGDCCRAYQSSRKAESLLRLSVEHMGHGVDYYVWHCYHSQVLPGEQACCARSLCDQHCVLVPTNTRDDERQQIPWAVSQNYCETGKFVYWSLKCSLPWGLVCTTALRVHCIYTEIFGCSIMCIHVNLFWCWSERFSSKKRYM